MTARGHVLCLAVILAVTTGRSLGLGLDAVLSLPLSPGLSVSAIRLFRAQSCAHPSPASSSSMGPLSTSSVYG